MERVKQWGRKPIRYMPVWLHSEKLQALQTCHSPRTRLVGTIWPSSMRPLAWRPWQIGVGDTTCHVEGCSTATLRMTTLLGAAHGVLTSSLPAATSLRSKSPALKCVQPNRSTIFAHCVPFPALLMCQIQDPCLGNLNRGDQKGHFSRATLTLAPRAQKQPLWIQYLPFACAYTGRDASLASVRTQLSAEGVEDA